MSDAPHRLAADTSALDTLHGNQAVAISELDSNRFGLLIARQPSLTRVGIESADAFCRGAGVDLLITRCSAADVENLLALQDNGFRVMDTLVRWRRHLANVDQHIYKDIVVGPLDASDSDCVAGIANAAFQTYSGHYHADARLSSAHSTDLYVSWASRSITDISVADVALGARWHGALVGFLTLKGGENGVWDVPLAAVEPRAQRRGILTALLSEAMVAVRLRGGKDLEYGCIVTNIGAQKALARLRFEISDSYHTLHKWFKD